MKYLFSFLLWAYCLHLFSAKFSLDGEILNIENHLHVKISYASLSHGLYSEIIVDSILVSNGIFHIDGEIPELTSATIEIKGKRYRFYIEPLDIKLSIDIQKPYIHLSGTSIDDEYKEALSFYQQNDSVLYSQFDYFRSHPYELKKGKEDTFTSYLQICFEREQLLLDFCKSHQCYRIVPDLLSQALEIDTRKELTNIEQIRSIYLESPDTVKNSLLGKLLDSKIRQYTKSRRCIMEPVGSEAPDFLSTTTKGDTLQLSSFRDRDNVILLFFSSRFFGKKAMSHIIHAIHKDTRDIKDPATVIGIDLNIDTHKRRHPDDCQGLPFPVIRDNWSNDLFQIREWDIGSLFPGGEFPYYFLIDKKGIIIKSGSTKSDGSPFGKIRESRGGSIDHFRE